jgi:hypothetical protein
MSNYPTVYGTPNVGPSTLEVASVGILPITNINAPGVGSADNPGAWPLLTTGANGTMLDKIVMAATTPSLANAATTPGFFYLYTNTTSPGTYYQLLLAIPFGHGGPDGFAGGLVGTVFFDGKNEHGHYPEFDVKSGYTFYGAYSGVGIGYVQAFGGDA